jgi:NAD(P)-dependent dehydrogenase (short-subunit alcohol dehydrogenase family)/acyl carrier protein
MAGSTWSGGSPELHLLTVGSQRLRPDGSDIDHPAGALGWGLLKAVPFELPTIAYRCVDVVDDVDVDLLWGELTRDSNDAEIALRDGHRHVRRLVAGQPPEGAPAVELVRPGGAYVIAGGTGGIGRELARHLVAAGATRLALLGRSASAATGLARELQAGGATVDLLDVDLADAGGLDAALDLVRRHGEIRGVAHAAGVLADGALRDMTRADVATVLRAKVDGTCNLDRATDGDDLDWFVLFSSAAGVLGSPGQANYAAANAYLDAFAHLRQRRGRPVTVVDWGPWAETGMAAGSRLAERMESRTAATALAPADALSVLDDLVRCGAGQTVAVAFDLRNLLQFFPLGRSASFFQELRTADVDQLNSIGRASRHGRPALRAPYRVPAGPVEERIAAIWEVSLGIAPIGADDDFFELGGDSVFGNQIVAEVNRELGIAIDAAEAFDAFTVANLAALAEAEGARLVGALTDDEARALLGAREAGDG